MAASTDLVVGSIAGHSRSLRAPHRDGNDTPITTTVTLTVPMSHEDIEAALWLLLRDEGVTFADLADDSAAVWLLLDSMIGRGTAAVESYRMDLDELTAADPNYRHYLRLRRRVDDLVGPRPGRRRSPRPPTRRTTCPAGDVHQATDLSEPSSGPPSNCESIRTASPSGMTAVASNLLPAAGGAG